MFKPSPLKHKGVHTPYATEEEYHKVMGGEVDDVKTDEELSEEKKQETKTTGINAGIDALIDASPLGGVFKIAKSGMDLYHSLAGDEEEDDDGWTDDD